MKRKRLTKHERVAAEVAWLDNVMACGALVLERLGYRRYRQQPAWMSPKGWTLFKLSYAREPCWTIWLAERLDEGFGELTTGQLAPCAQHALDTEPPFSLADAIREEMDVAALREAALAGSQ